jgi:3-mercaptopyruvate sulfurtransferase SseA
MGPLVSTDWLAGELGRPDLVVFDATKYLPNEAKDGRAEFLGAHIPGARYFEFASSASGRGCDYLVTRFACGNRAHERSARSLPSFVSEVMSHPK